MTPNDHLAERYGDPVRGEHTPLEDWTELEQAHHRAELLAAMRPEGKPPPRRRRTPKPRNLPLADHGLPRFNNREEPHARRAKGTTLAELLDEDWGT